MILLQQAAQVFKRDVGLCRFNRTIAQLADASHIVIKGIVAAKGFFLAVNRQGDRREDLDLSGNGFIDVALESFSASPLLRASR